VQHGERAARQTIALYAVLLVAATMLFVPFRARRSLLPRRRHGPRRGVPRAVAGAGLRVGPKFDTNRWAKHVFAFSVVYLPALLIALLVARA